MRVLPLATLLAVLSLPLLGCSDADEAPGGAQPATATPVASSASGDAERIGTITATLDGEARTWHALVGTISDEEQASSYWVHFEDDETPTGLVGGYDTPDVDFSTFEFEPGRGQVSFGTYDGSLLTITFPFAPGQPTGPLPVSDATDATVLYLTKADFEADMQTNYHYMSEGQLELTEVEVEEGGPCRFAGTFSGTLMRMDEATSMPVEDGSFDIDGCLYLELGQ